MTVDAATMARLGEAVRDLSAPVGVLDLDALDANADDLMRRAAGKPIRVASKSVRCRDVLRRVLARDGFRGILAYTLAEALWLADEFDDIVVGYPTGDLAALRALGADSTAAQRITLMIDDPAQLDLIEHVVSAPVRVCLDLDASLELGGGRVHIGARRSPLRTPDQAVDLARNILRRKQFQVVGLMCYEAQIAGVGNDAGSLPNRTAIRAMQMLSARELRDRRAQVVTAVQDVTRLEFVNGGGTGSVEATAAEPAVTEIAAGSGLYGPTLFDTYRHFQPRPAAFFVLDVVRKPTPDIATVLGGGWIASGATGADRQPTPAWPPGLALTDLEGAGEVQTPLTGAGALRVGDRVWFRHTKAGELCEHLNELHAIGEDSTRTAIATYRGERQAFL